jgi:hypothetical protein
MTFYTILLLSLLLLFASCTSVIWRVSPQHFQVKNAPPAPDYSLEKHWAALPNVKNPSDFVPKGFENEIRTDAADVFFVYPTIHSTPFPLMRDKWNANVEDRVLNALIDEICIKAQASVFNAAGRVFAPRYREVHSFAYITRDKKAAEQAFDLAYNDVKRAFEYYLAHHNHSRPIIIASHSQGTNHCIRLVKEFFDGKPLQKQLVCAYLIGMPVTKNEFQYILPSQSPTDVGCFVTWRTFKRGTDILNFKGLKMPRQLYEAGTQYCVTNPLTWKTTDTGFVSGTENKGGFLANKTIPFCADAEAHEGILWAKFHYKYAAFHPFLWQHNYHLLDYQLFYGNTRANAVERVQAFEYQLKIKN